jgi:hypothetical protein
MDFFFVAKKNSAEINQITNEQVQMNLVKFGFAPLKKYFFLLIDCSQITASPHQVQCLIFCAPQYFFDAEHFFYGIRFS